MQNSELKDVNTIQDPSQERVNLFTPSSSPNKKLKIVFLIFIVLLTASGLVYAGYLYGKFKTQDSELKGGEKGKQDRASLTTQPQPTQDPTTGWQTYTNTRLGFSIKLPPGIIAVENQYGQGITLQEENRLQDQNSFSRNLTIQRLPSAGVGLPYALEKIRETEVPLGEEGKLKVTVSRIIGNKEFRVEKQKSVVINAQYEKDGEIWDFSSTTSPEKIEEQFTFFSQILSTFRFLDEVNLNFPTTD